MSNICVVTQIFLCLNIVKLHLVNSSELNGDAPATEPSFHNPERDMMTINMYRVYEKYSKHHHQQQNVNTVRSFRAVPELSHHRVLFHFNLTSIPNSEVILTSTLHFLDQQSRQRPWHCRRSRGASCRIQHLQPLTLAHLIIKGTSPNAAITSQLCNITMSSNRKGQWQITDVSLVIKHAQAQGELSITVEFDFGDRHQRHQDHLPPHSLPFILVYTNDIVIKEPNSVTTSLQRYSPSPVGEEKGTKPPSASLSSRIRREVVHLQNNYLPDVHYNDLKNKELWDNTFFVKKPKLLPKGLENHERLRVSQELSFDEKTMKKARRKQWSEPRMCTRRYLRVDFADIGWSEWILAPKAFDAYYCAGTCGFPIPKVVHPSNHATIQSIVRAVGIVPGVPEPCCVPDKMSPLAVLFLDTSRNIVLKVFPSMSVETCACL
ncbi:growth/differentiation factor 10b [Myxocyprinus asiaticus]|uniref:growth/differentiation factor 10b n=1 Tax=Myxocyprinus asiaticus TaxID=70543 RepID=UPI002221864D|nr:growth/differentiation factor 10b [Myxocyprinus asiaticus]